MWSLGSSNLLCLLSEGSGVASPGPEKSPEAGEQKNANNNGQKVMRLSLNFLSGGHFEMHADLFKKNKASES